jgi:adenylate cyclase
MSPELIAVFERIPFKAGRDSVMGRALLERRAVHIVDAQTDPDYNLPTTQKVRRGRSLLGVPLMREGTPVGVIAFAHYAVKPFTDEQIELVETFADQAVIAMENVRLLNELRESLEQQTATSEVLQIISSSPGELKPVFDAMLANATRICGAQFGLMWLAEGEDFRSVAMHGLPPAHAEERQRNPVIHPGPASPLKRVARTKQVVHIADLRTEEQYIKGVRSMKSLVDNGGARTLLMVPMLKKNSFVGAITIFSQTVRPFTDKQTGLLINFAAQAVIAIENTRLLNDLNKLNQQLEQRVAEQVSEIERMSRLRRFLSPQVADLIVASGTEKQLESHRREIAALFCDLRGFTSFSESSEPEDVMSLLREYHAAIGEIIIKYSGTLEHFAGDGVMVFFNDPIPVPNAALQAVQAALDMRTAIGSLTEKWRRLGHELGFGVGIAHGFATLGTIGFEGRFDYASIGMVSNVASRLCDEAKPGQILISPRVLMKVEGCATVEPVGNFTLKGISRPIAVYNVIDAVTPQG